MDNTLEQRVDALEKLLSVLITDIRATRTSISTGFEKIDENFTNINKKFNKLDTNILILQSKVDDLSGQTDDEFGKVHVKLISIKDEISKVNSVTGYEDAINNLKIVKGGFSE